MKRQTSDISAPCDAPQLEASARALPSKVR
jgi:hypothetical protein